MHSIIPEGEMDIGVGKVQSFKMGQCGIFVAKEDGIWHLSISHPQRYPSWEEIKKARYELLPISNITVAMLLPPPDQYVNLHSNCFHLWEVIDGRGKGEGIKIGGDAE